MTRVAAVCLEPKIADLDGNLARAATAIATAAAEGADLIVLPELSTSGYVFETSEEAHALALAADDPRLARLGHAVGDAVLVYGFAEHGSSDRLYNSAAVIDGGELVTVYRKTHLWDREKLFFAAGDSAAPVVPTRAGRVGVLVCYDLEFPEMIRDLALRGAEVIAVPTNWPLVARPAGERPPEVIAAMAGARANRVVIACADRAGEERGVPFTGGTCIVDDQGWVSADRCAPGVCLADADLRRTADKTISPRNDVIADRRPELYRFLSSPSERMTVV